MTSTFTVYWAGVGTVVVALVGGFGGGMLVADRLSSSGSVPAPGKSRLAQVMADYERPKPVHVETTESFQPAVPPKSVNEPKSGAEVLEVRNPPVAESALRALAATAPPSWVVGMMDSIYMRALRPHHTLAEDNLTPFARRTLYVRAHWLRMPPHLLALHLSVKALRREEATP